MLNTTRAPHLSPDDWHDIIEAGGDPFATDLEGNSQPPINLPLPDLILLTRLAATFRNTDGLQKILQSRAVTIIVGLEPTPQLGKLLTGAVLPEGWTAQSRAPRSTSILVLQLPNNVLSAKELQHNLHCSAPMLLPFPHGEEVPHLLTMEGTGTNLLTLAELNADILIAVLSATHSATGRIDDDAVRAALPDDGKLAALDSAQLAVAFRANSCGNIGPSVAAPQLSRPRQHGKS